LFLLKFSNVFIKSEVSRRPRIFPILAWKTPCAQSDMMLGAQFYHRNWNIPKMVRSFSVATKQAVTLTVESAHGNIKPMPREVKKIGVTPIVVGSTGGTKQSKLMAEAHNHMPQGVAENYRYWGDEATVFVSKSKGCVLTDVDGKEFTDFRLGYGPIILGYCDERVDRAVCDEVRTS